MDKREFRAAKRAFNSAAYRVARSLSPGRSGEYGNVAYPDTRAIFARLLAEGRISEADFDKIDAIEFRRIIAEHHDKQLHDWLRSWNDFT